MFERGWSGCAPASILTPCRADQGEERDALHKMDIAAIQEHALESGAISGRVVPQVEPSREELLFGGAGVAFRMEWNQRFAIDIDEQLDAAKGASYSLFIDEREARLPATYQKDP